MKTLFHMGFWGKLVNWLAGPEITPELLKSLHRVILCTLGTSWGAPWTLYYETT